MSLLPEELTIPCGVEIPPISLSNQPELSIFGLPPGLMHMKSGPDGCPRIIGTPTMVGTYGVVVMPLGICVRFNVISLPKQPIRIEPITDKKYQIGQRIEPITVKYNDPRANPKVSGLPHGLTYDPLRSVIAGIPDVVGHFPITIDLVLFTQTPDTPAISFVIDIDGRMVPEITLTDITLQEVVADQELRFHQVDDQMIFTFSVKNTGTMTLDHIQLNDPFVGQYLSSRILCPGETMRINCLHRITQQDCEQGGFDLQTVVIARAHAIDANVTSITRTYHFTIRGYDTTHMLTKVVQTTHDRFTFMIYNNSNDLVNDITVYDGGPLGPKVSLAKNRMRPNGLIVGSLPRKGNNKLNLWITGTIPITNAIKSATSTTIHPPNVMIIGNIYQKKITLPVEPPIITIRAKHCLVKEEHPVTLMVNTIGSGSGSLVIYDGIKVLGHTTGKFVIERLEPGRHIIYAYNHSCDQGSNIILVLIGDEKDFSKEDVKTAKASCS